MKKKSAVRPSLPSTAFPLLAWNQLALKTAEMWLASAQVISHRTGRMALAGPRPSAKDRKEFHLMGQEKIEAAGESMMALSTRMFAANQQMGALMLRQMTAGAGSAFMLATIRTLAQSTRINAELAGRAWANSGAVANQLARSGADVLHHGMKPVHARATANAKRLAKVR